MADCRIIQKDIQIKKEDVLEAVADLQATRGRKWTMTALGILGSVLLVAYARYPERIWYNALGVMTAAEFLILLYQPVWRARRTARKITSSVCSFWLGCDGTICMGQERTRPLRGDKTACAVEGRSVFAIRQSREWIYILPKQGLQEEEICRVRKFLAGQGKGYLRCPAYRLFRE